MIRRPPRSTLFPTRRSSDLDGDEVLGRFAAELQERVRGAGHGRSEEHTSELQSLTNLVCRLLLEKTKIPEPYRNPISWHCEATPASSKTLRLTPTEVSLFFFLKNPGTPAVRPFPRPCFPPT